MSFDLFSAVGFNSYYLYFPFFFLFYFFWVNKILFIKNFQIIYILNKFMVGLMYNIINLGVVKVLSFFSFFVSIFFLFMMYSNCWNLVPYSLMSTSNIIWTLTLALFFWLVINLSKILKKKIAYFAHYTPEGAPIILIPFMNLIELVSNFIRPITLGVRLAVNLLTGHLLLSMYSNFKISLLINFNFFFFFFLMLGSFIYLYETGVALVQAFVYKLMMGQYANEHTF